MNFDVREALAAALARQGLVRDEMPAPVDMTPEQARETVWGAYGMSAPPVDEDEA